MIASLDPSPNCESSRKPKSRTPCRIVGVLPTRTVEQVLQDPSVKSQRWLVSELIPDPGFVVVYGAPKSGKTTLLTHMSAALVSGRPFLGRQVRSGPVLWLDLEQHILLTAETLSLAGAAEHSHKVHLFNGATPEDDSVLATIREIHPVVVVVDSLSRLLQLRDENDAAEMNRGLDLLLRISRDLGTAVLAIHHDRKRDGSSGRNLRGSSALLAAVDLAIEVRKVGEDPTRRQLNMTSRYSGVPDKLGICLKDDGFEVTDGPLHVSDEIMLASLAKGPLTLDEWAKALGLTRQGVGLRVRSLEESGKVQRAGIGRRGDPYRYFLPSQGGNYPNP